MKIKFFKVYLFLFFISIYIVYTLFQQNFLVQTNYSEDKQKPESQLQKNVQKLFSQNLHIVLKFNETKNLIINERLFYERNNFSTFAYHNKLISLLISNLKTFETYFEKIHTLKTSQQKYLKDWHYLMWVITQQLTFRDQKLKELQQTQLKNLIFNKIERLQNNADCDSTKKLVCSAVKYCGFGCLMHHLAYCFIGSLALNRTLVLTGTNIQNSLDFFHFLRPFNSHCLISNNQKMTDINDLKNFDSIDKIEYIKLPIIDNLAKSVPFRPLTVPFQLENDFSELSQFPFVLFVGNIIAYIMKLNANASLAFETYKQKLQLDSCLFVGVHVRRTDKLLFEAKYYSLKVYMEQVNKIFEKIEMNHKLKGEKKKLIKRVYLATDDSDVWIKEVPEYISQGYQFLGNPKFTINAVPEKRNQKISIEEVIMDILALSLSEYLVCTFSSQICRLAYELMQVQRPQGRDMSLHAYSLDDVYYFGGQISHRLETIMDNELEDRNLLASEHSFKVGDSLGVAKDLHNGYLFGDFQNEEKKDSRQLKYPKFKVIEKVISYHFKAFD